MYDWARDGLENVYDNNFMWGCYQKLTENENKNSGMIFLGSYSQLKCASKNSKFAKFSIFAPLQKIDANKVSYQEFKHMEILAILIEQKGMT